MEKGVILEWSILSYSFIPTFYYTLTDPSPILKFPPPLPVYSTRCQLQNTHKYCNTVFLKVASFFLRIVEQLGGSLFVREIRGGIPRLQSFFPMRMSSTVLCWCCANGTYVFITRWCFLLCMNWRSTGFPVKRNSCIKNSVSSFLSVQRNGEGGHLGMIYVVLFLHTNLLLHPHRSITNFKNIHYWYVLSISPLF